MVADVDGTIREELCRFLRPPRLLTFLSGVWEDRDCCRAIVSTS